MQILKETIADLESKRKLLQDQIGELEDTVQKEAQKSEGREEDLVQVLQQLQIFGKKALVCDKL